MGLDHACVWFVLCTSDYKTNTRWTIVSAYTQRALTSPYWKSAKNASNKRAVCDHENTCLHDMRNSLMFAQKTDKFWFEANGMWNICRMRSTCSQFYPHIRAFGTLNIHEWFGLQVCIGFCITQFTTVLYYTSVPTFTQFVTVLCYMSAPTLNVICGGSKRSVWRNFKVSMWFVINKWAIRYMYIS